MKKLLVAALCSMISLPAFAAKLTDQQKLDKIGELSYIAGAQYGCKQDLDAVKHLVAKWTFALQITDGKVNTYIEPNIKKGILDQRAKKISCEDVETNLATFEGDIRKNNQETIGDMLEMSVIMAGAASECDINPKDADTATKKATAFTNLKVAPDQEKLDEWKDMGNEEIKADKSKCYGVKGFIDTLNAYF